MSEGCYGPGPGEDAELVEVTFPFKTTAEVKFWLQPMRDGEDEFGSAWVARDDLEAGRVVAGGRTGRTRTMRVVR